MIPGSQGQHAQPYQMIQNTSHCSLLRSNCMLVAVLCLFGSAAASENQEAAVLAKKFVESSSSDRDKITKKLRDLGMEAIEALRQTKCDDDRTLEDVRGLIVSILLESSKIDPEDAQIVHEVAREEGKGRRYGGAERLYGRAKKLYDELKKDAADRKDKIKEQEYKELRDVCEKMRDKANRKDRGDSGKGINLGIVRVGTHDSSEDWD